MKKRLFTLLSILAISVGLMQAQSILTIQGQITDDSTGAPAVHHPVMVTSDTLLLPGNGGPGNPGNPPAGFLAMAFTDVQGNYSIDIDLSTLNLPEVFVITPVCFQTHQIVPLPAIAGIQLLNFTVCALNPGGGNPGGGNPGGGNPGGGNPGGGIPGMGCHAMFIGFPDSVNMLTWSFHALPMSPTAAFAWDFGNGSTAVGQDVTSTFPAFGQYNVCLILTDTAFQCADTMCILINVDSTWFPGGGHPGGGNPGGGCPGGGNPGGGHPGMGCHAMFIGFPDTANMLAWNFHALSMSPTAAFAWDFGNGSTAVGQDVTSTFPAFGQYNVCLILTDTAFQCADTMCILINVDSTWFPGGGHPGGGNPGGGHPGGGHPGGGNPGMGCHAMFIGFPDTANMLTWNFHALSMSPTAEFAWDFGNGSTAVGQDVTTTFPAFGQYNVCLILTDTAFQCTDTMCILVDVDSTWFPGGGHPGGGNPGGGMNCIADFDYVIGSNGVVSFTDLSQPVPTHWLWDFGDGNQSADQNPIHTYNSTGTFDVTLTIGFTNCLCTDSTSQTITIPVSISTTLGTTQTDAFSFSQPYPNPASDKLYIDISNASAGAIEMIVSDLTGKQIMAKTAYAEVGSQRLELNTSALPGGMYLLILQQSSGKTMSYKFTRIR